MTTDTPPNREGRADIVSDADGIMAVEGFQKSEKMRSLDRAYIDGRVTLQGQLSLTLLEARIVGARSVLAAIGPQDPRHAGISYTLATHETQLRDMAQSIGHDVAAHWGDE